MFTKEMKVDRYIIKAENIESIIKKRLKKEHWIKMNEKIFNFLILNVYLKITRIEKDHLIIDIWNEDITGVILPKNKSLYNRLLIDSYIKKLLKYIKVNTKIIEINKTTTYIEGPNNFIFFLFCFFYTINIILLIIILYNIF